MRGSVPWLLALAGVLPVWGAGLDTQLLDRTGQRVKQFSEELSSVSSVETVLQEKLNEKGKVVLNSRTAFDYLLNLRFDSAGLLMDESRLAIGQSQKKAPQGALLSTQGFATLMLIFHPEYQPSYAYTMLGEEQESGRKVVKVGFLARNGMRSPGMLALKGRDYPITWEGAAWIDAEQAVVTRVEAHWREPAEEIGLEELSTDVRYAPVAFRGGMQTFWLPETARIQVKTRHQQWRNTHQFSKYKLFSVETQTKTQESKP